MKHWMLALALAVATLGLGTHAPDAEAKRLGGGRPAGMQRQLPAKPADATPAPTSPATQPGVAPAAQPGMAAAPGAAAAQAGKRSWLGPVAGIAAGLGLAALASHLGFGEGLANIMTLLLMGLVAVVVLRWVMGRFKRSGASLGPQLAGAGAPYTARDMAPAPLGGGGAPAGPARGLAPQTAPQAATPPAPVLPAGLDAAEFSRLAKMIFIRLQAANDAGNVEDLRRFTTPELFASLRLDLQERGAAAQQTDVVQLDAQVVDATQQDGQSVVSVRYTGLLREEAGGTAQPVDEVWHLVRPLDGSREWAIAGIQPVE